MLRYSIGLYSGHALANLAFAAVLTSSFALLAFSKYRRAQIASLTDLLCISRFTQLISIVLPFVGLQVPTSSDCLLSCLYCICRFTQLILIFLRFTGLQVATSSGCPLPYLYCIFRFDFLNSTVLRLVCYLQALMSLDCSPTHLYCNRTTMGLVLSAYRIKVTYSTKGIDENRSAPL